MYYRQNNQPESPVRQQRRVAFTENYNQAMMAAKDEAVAPKDKKDDSPWYKKWWVWVLIVLAVLLVYLGAAYGMEWWPFSGAGTPGSTLA